MYKQHFLKYEIYVVLQTRIVEYTQVEDITSCA